MARYPDDFDLDEIDEIEHARGHRLGVEDVRFLSKRLGYRYVDWVHGDSLFKALGKYGEIPSSQKKLRRPRQELISMAMEYADWLDLMEGMIAFQNPHVWRKPDEMEGAPKGVTGILAELRMSLVRKLAAGELFAIGYFLTPDEPHEWPLWIVNYVEQNYFYRAHYDWEGSGIDGDFVAVRIVENLGESLLPRDTSPLPKRQPGRPGIGEFIREAFYAAAKQGLLDPNPPRTAAYETLRPLAVVMAAKRGQTIAPPGPETLRKHTRDLFDALSTRTRAPHSKAKAGPGV